MIVLDNGTSVSDVINKIVAKSNANTVDLDISIHFNSGANDKIGNGKAQEQSVLYIILLIRKLQLREYVQILHNQGFKNRGG